MKKSKNNRADYLTKVGIFSASLFVAATAAYIYSPIVGSNAEEDTTARIKATVNPVAALSLDVNQLSFNITPTSEGAFDSQPVTATVNTNSTGGYELYLSADSETTDMTHADDTITNVIASDFTETVTSSTMRPNKWGYSLDDTNFLKIPSLTSQAQIRNIDHYPSVAELTTSVYVGTKISTELPSGTYSNTLLFSVIAHDSPIIKTLFDIETMQEMTPSVCRFTTTPKGGATRFDWTGAYEGNREYVPRKVLVDTRDNKTYLVSKLADGNCWMSQNLAIDLTENEPVEISNNDGTVSTATPNYSTIYAAGESWSQAEDNWRSYHPEAEKAYYQNGVTQSSTPTASGDEYAWESAGVYYNWYAATGGSGTVSLDSGEAPSSLCPKGWRLPTMEGSKSLYNLYAGGYNLSDMLTETAGTAFRADPLNFTLAGGYNWMSHKLDHAAENAFYWMSTAYNSTNAYRLSAKTTYIKPQGNYHKGYGMTVRCVNI